MKSKKKFIKIKLNDNLIELLNSKGLTENEFLNIQKDFASQYKNFQKQHGFNVSPDKKEASNNFYFLTEYIVSKKFYTDKISGKKKVAVSLEKLYDNIDQAFKCASNYRQVFSGLNHTRRDIAVADIDNSLPACYTKEEELDRINYIHEKCDLYNLPYPSYIEFHTDSGHCQFGWYLTEYFVDYGISYNSNKDLEFKKLIKGLAKLFNSDERFGCANMKNPYHKMNHAYFNSTEQINTKYLIESVNKALAENNIVIEVKSSKASKHKLTQNVNLEDSLKESRNCYALKKTIGWVYVYMRKHNKSLPDLDSTIKMFSKFEEESLSINGKSNIESYGEIKASVIGLLNFCKKEYDSSIAEKCEASSMSDDVRVARRASSLITRKGQKAIKYFKAVEMKKEGVSQQIIASTLSCSQSTISVLLNSLDREEALLDLKNYYLKHQNSKITKHKDIIEEILSVLDLINISIDSLIMNKEL